MTVTKQFGGVSLFIVIFVALITTAVSVSFTQVMIRNQQQATASDLSGRAYDSALAGVEDAKRLVVALYKQCNEDPASNKCRELRGVLDDTSCSRIISEFGGSTNATSGNFEKAVGDDDANQAYTCVKVALSTLEYTDQVTTSESTVLPLRSKNTFNKLEITWFTKEDAAGAASPVYYTSAAPSLPQAGTTLWRSNNPSLLRLQLIPGSSTVASLDTEAKTVYLYPRPSSSPLNNPSFNSDSNNGGSLAQIKCRASFSDNVKGACTATIDMNSTDSAYLQLAAFYNQTHFTIKLLGANDNPVAFDSVQPTVDSTGRADNVFRRVQAKIKVGAVSVAYPEGSVQTGTNFCKAFSYQENRSDGGYIDGACNP